jgi:hypothetical protein
MPLTLELANDFLKISLFLSGTIKKTTVEDQSNEPSKEQGGGKENQRVGGTDLAGL